MASESASENRGSGGNRRSWIVYVPDDSGAKPALTSFLRLGARYDPAAPGALSLGAESEAPSDTPEDYGLRLQTAGELSQSVTGQRFSLTRNAEGEALVEADYSRPTAAKTNRRTRAARANEDSYGAGERLDFHDGPSTAPQVGLEVRSNDGGRLTIGQALAEASITDTAASLEAGAESLVTRLPRLGAKLEEQASSDVRVARRLSLGAAPAAVAEGLAESRGLAEAARTAMLAVNAALAGIAKGLAEQRSEADLKAAMERGQAVVAMAQGLYGLLHLVAAALGVVKMAALRDELARSQAAGLHVTPNGVMLSARSAAGTAYLNLSGGMITMAAPVRVGTTAPQLDDRTAYDGAESERLLKQFERGGR